MKTRVLASILALSAITLASAQDKTTPDQPDRPGTREDKSGRTIPGEEPDAAPASENDFIAKAAQRGRAEIKVAELARTKAKDAAVKEFAETMVRDHTAADKELTAIARELNIPDETPNPKAEEKFRELSNKTGAEFDKTFIEMMAHCHGKNIAFYEAGKKLAKNSELIAYIDKTLPILKSHSEKVQSLGGGRDKSGEVRPGATPRPGITDPAEPEKR